MIVLAMGCMGHVTSMGVKNETTMMHDSEFSLATRAVLPWSIAFPEGIIASEINPNASMFVTEGPQVRIMRSSVQLFASPSGVVGIAANGIHQNQRQMVDLTGKPVWINTAEPPLAALRLRDSSIVTASESEISRIAPNGGETRLVQGFYSLLCDAGEGHFWTADYQKGLAQYRDGAGKLVSQYPLKTAPGMVSDAKGRLCYVGASDSALSCLDVHGVRTREEGFTLEPWSTIVGYGDETLLTDVGGGIQFQVQHKSPKYLPIVSGGLTRRPTVYLRLCRSKNERQDRQCANAMAYDSSKIFGQQAANVCRGGRCTALLGHRRKVVYPFRPQRHRRRGFRTDGGKL
ncbi:MAG: hypothetical protein RLZZ519_3180 [Bacteroidota bacterium]|jgi:hypothetical protein